MILNRASTKIGNSVRFLIQTRGYGSSTSHETLKKTSLNQLHKDLGGKMVEFCGWEMPVMYKPGVLKEHLHCRQVSSLFDVSHMAQLKIHGKDRVPFFESLVVADLAALPAGNSKLSVFTNDKGGIIDDTMITNAGDFLYVVVNAGCADKDIAHINAALKAYKSKSPSADVAMEIMNDHSLIAVQGPETERLVAALAPQADLSKMEFMTQMPVTIAGIPCTVTRCGYTGEDGFEISVPSNKAVALAEALMKVGSGEKMVLPAGLGARDSLRLEAGLCLYGHDLNDDITPVEGALTWLIGKRRKETGGFPGADVILRQIKEGVSKKRVGIVVNGAPAREGTDIIDVTSKQTIGRVTSGTLSPCNKQSISMAYIQTPFSKLGTSVTLNIRGKETPGVISKMPFIPHNYKKSN